MKRHITGRTDVQLRERWVNVLNPDLTQSPWTIEEDQALESAMVKYGLGKWAKVAEDLYPRTDNQCLRRWKKLHSEKYQEYYDSVIKKRMLVRNFVGREKERPEITTSDIEIDPAAVKRGEEWEKKHRKKHKGYDFSSNTIEVPENFQEPPSVTVSIKSKPKENEYITNHYIAPNSKSETTENITLPIVLPSPVTFIGLYNLLSTIDQSEAPTDVNKDVKEAPEYGLLSSWMNCLFSIPTMIYQDQKFVSKDLPIENLPPSDLNDIITENTDEYNKNKTTADTVDDIPEEIFDSLGDIF